MPSAASDADCSGSTQNKSPSWCGSTTTPSKTPPRKPDRLVNETGVDRHTVRLPVSELASSSRSEPWNEPPGPLVTFPCHERVAAPVHRPCDEARGYSANRCHPSRERDAVERRADEEPPVRHPSRPAPAGRDRPCRGAVRADHAGTALADRVGGPLAVRREGRGTGDLSP